MTSRRYPRSQRHPVRKKKFSPLLSSAAIALCIAAGFAWLEHSGPLSRFGFAAGNNPLILSRTPLPRNLVAGNSEAIRKGNYRAIDEQASTLEYRGDSPSELAGLLSRYAVTEAEKARVIYAWIAHHITYDVASYQSRNYGDVTPQGVLRSRSTVCAGYANLYQALAQEMGLEASVIEGYGRGNGYLVLGSSTINHAWNAVRIDRAWYVLDVTWGAGTVSEDRFQPDFNPYYFATPPKQMIYSHFPAQSSWQLLPVPYTKTQFDDLPKVSASFFANGLQFGSHFAKTIRSPGMTEITLRVPDDTVILARLHQNAIPIEEHYTFTQQKNGQGSIKVTFPAAGTYELQIFSKRRAIEGPLTESLIYEITATGNGSPFPKLYASFGDNNAYLYNPTTGRLPIGQYTAFQIEVANALEVMVVDGASGNWTPLRRSAGSFVGNIAIGTGKISLVAKFPGSEQYMTLAEYN
jgi:hypothetical protein